MKKVISLVLALMLCLPLCACGAGNDTTETKSGEETNLPTENQLATTGATTDSNAIIDANLLLGTWQLISMDIGDSTFTFAELIDLGMAKEEEKDNLIFVFQEGGKVYNGANGNILDWSVSNGIITFGVVECQYSNGVLSVPGDECAFNMKKISDSQVIGNTAETEPQDSDQPTDKLIDGMRPEFKEAMDAYEAFYDEYCEFMAEYEKNPSDMTLLLKYTEMLAKMTEMNEAFEAWDEEELNDAELKYYLDVSNRVMQKLIDVAG